MNASEKSERLPVPEEESVEQGPRAVAERLHDIFAEHGIETSVVEISGNKELQQAIIFPHKYDGDEPLVRVYRGINQLDETLLNQVPYALRSREEGADALTVLNHAREQVDALTADPTYEHLIAYVDAVWPDLTDREIERFAETLQDIEDATLEGMSLRRSLVHETYGFNGGKYADTGIAPYISASTDMREASGYGGEGIMVIDIPVSKLEAMAAKTNGEVVIKGAIPMEYIAAILPRANGRRESAELVVQDVQRSCSELDAQSTHAVLDSQTMKATFDSLRDIEKKKDDKQHETDVAAIRARRTKLLLAKIPGERPSREAIAVIQEQENTDIYTAAKRAVYDEFVTRFLASGGEKEALEEDYEFSSQYNFNTNKTDVVRYTRDAVTDDMLQKLHGIVVRNEEHFRARQFRDALRKAA